MAFSDLSFKFYTDSGLTSAFSNLYQLTHATDGSTEPQTRTLHFGSTSPTGRTLQAQSNPGVDQITLTPTVITPEWLSSTAYSLGAIVEPTTPNSFVYKVITAGTSDSSEPTWPTTVGSTVVDGTTVWICFSAAHPATEIKLALTEAGLDSATGGAALNLGTEIESGTANKVTVWIRFTNTVTNISNNTGYPGLGLNLNAVQEVAS